MPSSTTSIHRHHLHTHWDHSLNPVARVKSGALVEFDCLDASNGQITATSTYEDFQKANPLFGPVFVEGAEPGDALEVEFLRISTGDFGWTAIFKGFGLLHSEDFAGVDALKLWSIQDGYASAQFGSKRVKLPTRPFCGEIGVARGEPGAWSAIPPYSTGGNIDTRHLVAGSRIFLPVEVPGALFSLGDGHALQGDGEVCGVAIETPIQATVRLTLHPKASLPHTVRQPQYLTAPHAEVLEIERQGFFTTMGIAPDMLAASEMAVRHMIEYMVGTAKGEIRIEDAYMLCSVAGDLHACEVVDMPNYAMGLRMPQYVLGQIRG